jgi:hypothetical protein
MRGWNIDIQTFSSTIVGQKSFQYWFGFDDFTPQKGTRKVLAGK